MEKDEGDEQDDEEQHRQQELADKEASRIRQVRRREGWVKNSVKRVIMTCVKCVFSLRSRTHIFWGILRAGFTSPTDE